MKITLDGLSIPVRPRPTKPRPGRKNNAGTQSEGWKASQFPKGRSGNPGGKPKVPYVRFSDKLAEELAKDAPTAMKRQVGLHHATKATQYDCLVAAMVQAAAAGDWQASLGIRDVIEGKLPTTSRNLNVSVSMQRFLEDPAFREFLDKQHEEYLKLAGEDFENGYTREPVATDVSTLPSGADATGVQKD